MRAEIERLKTETGTKDKQLQALEARIKEYEAKGIDVDAMVAKAKTLEGQIENLNGQLRRARKEVDPAFQQKWQQPFDEAVTEALDMVTTMEITDPDTGAVRKGTQDDVMMLHNIENPQRRNAEIRKMFGEDSISLIPKFDRMRSINNQWKRALEQEKAKAAELDKQERAQAIQHETARKEALEKLAKDLSESVPEYRDAPDDTESAEARQKALRLFDTKTDSPQAANAKYAHVRQMVGAFFPMKLKIARLEAQLKEANDKLKGLEEPDPNTPPKRSGAGSAAAPDLTWEEAARKELT